MKKIGVLGLMAALAVTGVVAFLPKGVMAAEDSDQTISQGVYIGDVDVFRDDARRSRKKRGRWYERSESSEHYLKSR